MMVIRIKWPSYPSKLWKIIDSFFGSLKFMLNLFCAALPNLQVT